MTQNPYREVRSLRRGLMILEALSLTGWTTPADLGHATGIDRTTVYRLLGTLRDRGYLLDRTEDGAVSLSRKVASISSGVRDDDVTLKVVGFHLAELVKEVKWPSDFARLNAGRLSIEQSNHSLSPMTFHRATIGQERSLMRSALGKAVLSILTDEEAKAIQEISGQINVADLKTFQTMARRANAEWKRFGYTSAVGAIDTNVSAISVPLRCRSVACALNIVFFRTAMTPSEAAVRYLGALQQCANAINQELETLA